jgi:hypothetical protein
MGDKRSIAVPVLFVGGGLAAAGAVWLASRRSAEVAEETTRTVAAGGRIKVRLTGYWPFAAKTETEKRMEGGVKDRKGKPLFTLEQHLADPQRAPYVAVAGDDAVWPYGQRIVLDEWPNAIFRVVDTGGHFRGANKVYRALGHEPLDICVDSSKTKLPKTTTARILAGDNFAGGRAVATAGIRDQVISGVQEGRTTADREALARAIESELHNRTREEAFCAAWAMRNRADDLGVTVADLLAPGGRFGSPRETGGYASTRKAPSARSRNIANEVLDAPRTADPTGGAIEFWIPSQQDDLHRLGEIYRMAVRQGDVVRALKFLPFADYGSADAVRAQFAEEQLEIVGSVGAVELLGRTVS